MSAAQVLGSLLIASPFVAIFAVAWRLVGLVETVAIFALAILLAAVLGAGVYLTTGTLQ